MEKSHKTCQEHGHILLKNKKKDIIYCIKRQILNKAIFINITYFFIIVMTVKHILCWIPHNNKT